MGKDTVSIIIPIYNTEQYIEECIQSAISQSEQSNISIELILINDGSTDGSAEICNRYRGLKNVQYIEQDRLGVVAARKRGVFEAHGEWITFVDSDDYLLPGAIQKLMFYSMDSDIVISRHLGSRALQDAPYYYTPTEYLYRVYSISTSVSPWAKLFKKQLVLNTPEAFLYNLDMAEDHPMNLAIALTNKRRVAICKDAVYYYRQRPGSITHSGPFTLDLCENLCNINDRIVGESIPYNDKLICSINQRVHYYKYILKGNNYHVDKNHPYVRGLIRRMNEARVLRLNDRILLSISNKTSYVIAHFISSIISRVKNLWKIISGSPRI